MTSKTVREWRDLIQTLVGMSREGYVLMDNEGLCLSHAGNMSGVQVAIVLLKKDQDAIPSHLLDRAVERDLKIVEIGTAIDRQLVCLRKALRDFETA